MNRPLNTGHFRLLASVNNRHFTRDRSAHYSATHVLFRNARIKTCRTRPMYRRKIFSSMRTTTQTLQFFARQRSLSSGTRIVRYLRMRIGVTILSSKVLHSCLKHQFTIYGNLRRQGVSYELTRLLTRRRRQFLMRYTRFIRTRISSIKLMTNQFIGLTRVV